MSISVIRKLLETQLNSVSTGFATAYENVPMKPVAGTPYQRVHLLPARPENPTMGDGFRRDQGILQVLLSFPVNAGPHDVQARAETVLAGFPRGLSMTEGTLRVLIDSSPYIGPSLPDGGAWHSVPLSIPYVADVFA